MDIDRSKLSPMMQQYFGVKDKYKNHILFYRLGDFYEMFFDDALTASKVLELTLTGRDCGLEERAPMCGVPFHSAEIYIKKLIEAGFTVAVCEQLTDPKLTKCIVERDVIRVVTPGTLTETNMLDESKNNYICCVYALDKSITVCFTDISTGEVDLYTKSGSEAEGSIINELSRYQPAELLFNSAFLDCKEIQAFLKNKMKCIVQLLDDISFTVSMKKDVLLKQFSAGELCELGLDDDSDETRCVCGLFDYIADTQKALVGRFTTITKHSDSTFMELDLNARRNLELTETLRNKEKRGSLMWVLDSTKTSMGKRLLSSYIEQPLVKPAVIINRLDAVEQLCKNSLIRQEISDSLGKVYDLERLMTKVMYRSATPRDLKALSLTALALPEIKEKLSGFSSILLKNLNNDIDALEDISNLIENAISDEPPVSAKEGGIIKDGFNSELDELRRIISGGKDIITEIEQREKEKTGIKNLKISYNRVFGYYIEVTKSYYDLVPENYIRKQTLANCERFITEELKNAENTILGANDKVLTLEYDIFCEVREFIATQLVKVQTTASAVATLDVLCPE